MKAAAAARTAARPTSSPPASRSRRVIEPAGAGMTSPAPTLDQVRALAYAALLDHARRSDHAHALATLMRALASLTGAECWLWPQPPGGDLSMPPIHARPPMRGAEPSGGEAVETALP